MGAHLGSIRDGLESVADDLRGDLSMLESGRVGVISYAGNARQDVAPMELMHFQAPELAADGGHEPSLNAALSELNDSIDSQGDEGKPLVFVLAGGTPSKADVNALSKAEQGPVDPSKADVVAIGCGKAIDGTVLRKVATQQDRALILEDDSSNGWAKFFKAISTPMSDAMLGRQSVRMEPVTELTAFASAELVEQQTVATRAKTRTQPRTRAKQPAKPRRIPKSIAQPVIEPRSTGPMLGDAFGKKSEEEQRKQPVVAPVSTAKEGKSKVGTAFRPAQETAEPAARITQPGATQKTSKSEKQSGLFQPAKRETATVPRQTAKVTRPVEQQPVRTEAKTSLNMGAWGAAGTEQKTAAPVSPIPTGKRAKKQGLAPAWGTRPVAQPRAKQASQKKQAERVPEEKAAKSATAPVAQPPQKKEEKPVTEAPKPVEPAPVKAEKAKKEPAAEAAEPVEAAPAKAEKKAKPKRAKRRRAPRRRTVEDEGLMEME